MSWAQQRDDDPHGIQQLLSLLRTQQDGQQSGGSAVATAGRSAISDPAFAAVVKQRISTGGTEQFDNAKKSSDVLGAKAASTASTDLRYISFAQALPHLSQLSREEQFLKALLDLKANQDQFEAILASERERLAASLDDDVQSTDADRRRTAKERLRNWDREALGRWDWLYAQQQEKLQKLGVPSFFATRDPSHVRRQQRVFDVLAGLLE